MAKSMKLGGGGRFAAGVAAIKAANKKPGRKKIENPAAVMAMVGRKKYGMEKMAEMSGMGRHKAAMTRHKETMKRV